MRNQADLFEQCARMIDNTPVAELAKAVCVVRGFYPYDPVGTRWGQLDRWKAIVFEMALLDHLRAAMAPY